MSIERESKTIVIKPVSKVKFSGQTAYTNTRTSFEGAQLGKGGYKTGLTKEEEIKFAEELNLPKGTLHKSNGEFWGNVLNMSIPNDKPYTFVVDSLMDEIKLRVLMEHSAIANNEVELAKNPGALFYIEDKEAAAKVEELEINVKMDAHDALRELTVDEQKGYLKLYGRRGVDQLSERMIKTELFKKVEDDPKRFLTFVKNPDIALRIKIEDMLESGVLTKRGSYYQFENEVIGNSIEAVIAFFKDYKNQSLKIAAEQATKDSKKKK